MRVAHMLKWGILAADMVLAGPLLYLAVLSITAIRVSKHRRGATNDSEAPSINFGILVPAHNEEETLGTLLASLSELAYPMELYHVYIVADNCSDHTASLARAAGWIRVYERHDDSRRGKGYAINWILQKLESDEAIHDAYVILDADSVVDPDFLTAMARELGRGTRALQGRYSVLNVDDAPSTALRSISLILVNHLRPLGRSALGFSSTLTGNGMCLSRDLIRRYPWQAFALGEDYQYYLTLVEHGERVRYVPDAVVQTPMPTTFAQMRTQDVRWESSQGLDPAWKVALRLFSAGLRYRDLSRIEAVAEFLTPPLSFLVSGCMATLFAAAILEFPVALLLSLLLTGCLLIYVGAGLHLLGPSHVTYKVLLYAPAFMAWKLWVVLVLARSKKHTSEWVRTSRTIPGQGRLKG